jgi:K+ transport systems, NAD-binding component
MKIIIVGGGNNVYFLTKVFISKGYDVTIINSDKEECIKLARIYNIVTVHGDATKPYILEDAGAAYTDLVISLTGKDQNNLVICQISEKIFRVKKTFAVVNDPNNVEIFKN